jgi:hypothetical protein
MLNHFFIEAVHAEMADLSFLEAARSVQQVIG